MTKTYNGSYSIAEKIRQNHENFNRKLRQLREEQDNLGVIKKSDGGITLRLGLDESFKKSRKHILK